jgi:hypothetical protein
MPSEQVQITYVDETAIENVFLTYDLHKNLHFTTIFIPEDSPICQ